MSKLKSIQLHPGDVHALILLASVAWTETGRAIAKVPIHGQETSLYDDLKGTARRIADMILAIHARDKVRIRRLHRYCETAWAFIADSIWRHYWPMKSGEEEEFKREWARLDPLRPLVNPYLPKKR